MTGLWRRWELFFRRRIWEIDLEQCSRPKRHAIQVLRLLTVVVRDFLAGELNLWAMSLVYTTLLSLVPLLAVSFSVLKAFGVQNIVEPLLDEFLAPLGPRGADVSDQIVAFVENVNAGVLGGVGMAFLVYTVISLISKIEEIFNRIWRIKTTRSFIERFSDYLSVLVIGPVLVFAAMGLTASMMNSKIVQTLIAIEPFGTAYYIAGVIVPYILIFAAFTYVYTFLPNTTVRLKPAFGGAVVAGLLWKAAGWIFTAFIANSTRYNAIYSGFAILIVFMIWIYISWLIFVLGAQIAYYLQYKDFIRMDRPDTELSQRLKEKLALTLMYWIGRQYYRGETPWTLEALSQRFQMPQDVLSKVLTKMERRKLLTRTADEPPRYVPARGLDAITVREVLGSVRRADEDHFAFDDRKLDIPEVEDAIATMEAALESAFGGRTLREWIITAEHDNL